MRGGARTCDMVASKFHAWFINISIKAAEVRERLAEGFHVEKTANDVTSGRGLSR